MKLRGKHKTDWVPLAKEEIKFTFFTADVSRRSPGDQSSAWWKITRIIWNRKPAYGLMVLLKWPTGRPKMKIHLHKILYAVLLLFKNLIINTSIQKTDLTILSTKWKLWTFWFCLSLVKIISYFLLRCHKRSSTWILHIILLYVLIFRTFRADCERLLICNAQFKNSNKYPATHSRSYAESEKFVKGLSPWVTIYRLHCR